MASVKIALQWHGTRQFWRALDRASVEIRKRVATATAFTAQEVAHGARARVPRRTGELANTIRAEPTASPFVWVVSAGFGRVKRRRARTVRRKGRVRRIEPPGVYAAVVEFGSRGRANQPAQPFLFPALEASYRRHVARIARAWDDGAKLAARGA